MFFKFGRGGVLVAAEKVGGFIVLMVGGLGGLGFEFGKIIVSN